MSLAAESCRSRAESVHLLKPYVQWGKDSPAETLCTMGKGLKEFQLCDSRRLCKKAQDAQDDVIKFVDLFHARFWGWKGILNLDSQRRSSPVYLAAATVLPGNFEFGKQNPSNLLFRHGKTSGLHCGINRCQRQDAFLTVKQKVDTRVTCRGATGNSMQIAWAVSCLGKEMEACFGQRLGKVRQRVFHWR